jgi:glycosyltransferase involved in cell wall biosynthesis
MNNSPPKVSVVMAVYNGATYLRPAVESVLGQSFLEFEFIVVDDGSTDETTTILHSYQDARLRVILQANHGPAAAGNRGIRASEGLYIARLDADDVAAPERLQQQMAFLDQNHEYVLVGGFLEFVTAKGVAIYQQTLPTKHEDILQTLEKGGNPFLHSAVMYRRKSAMACGLYNENLHTGVDPDFIRRLIKTGKAANLPVCVGQYRITPGAISNQRAWALRKRSRILGKARTQPLTAREKQYLRDIVLKKNSRLDFSLYALRVARAYLQHTDDVKSARKYLWQSIENWPSNWPGWYNLILAYLSPNLRNNINRLRGLIKGLY